MPAASTPPKTIQAKRAIRIKHDTLGGAASLPELRAPADRPGLLESERVDIEERWRRSIAATVGEGV